MKKLVVLITLLTVLLSSCAQPAVAPPAAEAPVEQAAVQPTEQPTSPPQPTEEPTVLPTETVWEPVSVNMILQPYLGVGPIFIAMEEGFFEDEGLVIVPIEIRTSRDTATALASGQADVAATDISVTYFNIIAQNPALKIVTEKGFANPDSTCAYQGLVTLADVPDYTPGMDLSFFKGKTLDIIPGNQHHFLFDLLLEGQNFTTQDMTLTTIDPAIRIESMRSGQLYGISTVEPLITRYLAEGDTKLWIGMNDVLPNATVSTIMFGELFTQKNPEAGIRWMRAYLRAVEQYNQGLTDRNVEIFAKYTKLDPELIKKACPSDLRPSGEIDSESIMAYQEWAVKNNFMNAVVPLETLWDGRFLEAAKE